MMSRILPVAEWDRLAETPFAQQLVQFAPLGTDAQVLVVEDGDRVVAHWGAFRWRHVEGLWIRPESRGDAAVGRRLFAGMVEHLRQGPETAVLTGAEDDVVAGMLERVGAVSLPMRPYLWRLT